MTGDVRTENFAFLLRNYALPSVLDHSQRPACEMCCEPLERDEAERPAIVDGEVWCDACYDEHYRFLCCVCGEHEERQIGGVDVMHRFLAVFDADETGLDESGLYRVKNRPYYTNMMLYTILHDWMLERIGDAPARLVDYGYACGHLCLCCQEREIRSATTKG